MRWCAILLATLLVLSTAQAYGIRIVNKDLEISGGDLNVYGGGMICLSGECLLSWATAPLQIVSNTLGLSYLEQNGLGVSGGALYVKAGTGLGYDASGNLQVLYGSTAGTAVEGNTQISINAGTGLSGGGTITLGAGGSVTIAHADTSSATTVSNTGGTVIQSIGVDTFGHVTEINSVDLDTRYVPLSRQIDTVAPLTGGGALSTNLTLGINIGTGLKVNVDTLEMNITTDLSCPPGEVLTLVNPSTGKISCVSVDTNPDDDLTGTGDLNYIPYWIDSSTLGSTNIYYDSSNGRVGIGTNTPQARLHILETNADQPPLLVEANTVWYRRPITVTNSGATTLTDFQVLVTIDTNTLIAAGKMAPDCSDVWFTSSDGTTHIPYWLEGGCGTTRTRFWVKVPSIPAGGSTIIYMYYGDPKQADESNGYAVFEFFDDFEGDAINTNEWNVENTVTVENGVVRFYEGTYPDTNLSHIWRYFNGTCAVIGARGRTLPQSSYTTWNWAIGFSIVPGTENNDVSFSIMEGSDTLKITTNFLSSTNNFSTLAYVYHTIDNNVWYIAEAIRCNDEINGVLYDDFHNREENFVYLADTSSNAEANVQLIALGTRWANSEVDWVYVRKYANPEPTISVGAEEGNYSIYRTLALDADTGTLSIIGDVKARKLVDRDDNNYFIDPSGTSNVRWLNVSANINVGANINMDGNIVGTEWSIKVEGDALVFEIG